jgi:response regulator of citrate/malate metabolism
MSDGLDVIVVDDEERVCEVISRIIRRFYTWGDVLTFTDSDEAISHCLGSDKSIAIFVIDVFLGEKSGFYFLDAIQHKFPTAHYDTVMITGNASDDVCGLRRQSFAGKTDKTICAATCSEGHLAEIPEVCQEDFAGPGLR